MHFWVLMLRVKRIAPERGSKSPSLGIVHCIKVHGIHAASRAPETQIHGKFQYIWLRNVRISPVLRGKHVGRAPESCHYIKGNNVGGSMVVVSLNLLVDRGKHVGRAPEP